jgi:hypothetical protein
MEENIKVNCNLCHRLKLAISISLLVIEIITLTILLIIFGIDNSIPGIFTGIIFCTVVVIAVFFSYLRKYPITVSVSKDQMSLHYWRKPPINIFWNDIVRIEPNIKIETKEQDHDLSYLTYPQFHNLMSLIRENGNENVHRIIEKMKLKPEISLNLRNKKHRIIINEDHIEHQRKNKVEFHIKWSDIAKVKDMNIVQDTYHSYDVIFHTRDGHRPSISSADFSKKGFTVILNAIKKYVYYYQIVWEN